jgi:hypothetical protein
MHIMRPLDDNNEYYPYQRLLDYCKIPSLTDTAKKRWLIPLDALRFHISIGAPAEL